MTSEEISELKLNDLEKNFEIYDKKSVFELIKSHEEYLTMLDNVQPVLNKYFKNHSCSLYIRSLPIYYDYKLTISINVDYSAENPEDLSDRLHKLNIEILDFEKELDLVGKFFIELD